MLIIHILSLSLISCEKSVENPDYSDNSGEFKDNRDGKIYKWLKFGDQIWMGENLNFTGDNGFQIHITDDTEWVNNKNGSGWSYYNNNPDYATTYGVLYQWEAAKKACPEGWHLPSDDEWSILDEFLSLNGYSCDGIIGGKKTAKSLATATGWEYSDIPYSIGNTDYPEYKNKTGFSVLPAGTRSYHDGKFHSIGSSTGLWSSTSTNYDPEQARQYGLGKSTDYGVHEPSMKLSGYSIRCIKD